MVIFFYPKALTKGCTIESCGFRDIAKDFPDEPCCSGPAATTWPSQQKFIDTNMLPYPLLCDTKLELIKQLGISRLALGKTPKRVTFVVDKEGKIAKIYDKVDAATAPEGSAGVRQRRRGGKQVQSRESRCFSSGFLCVSVVSSFFGKTRPCGRVLRTPSPARSGSIRRTRFPCGSGQKSNAP